MKTEIAYIYALVDPIDKSVRYIGKSVNPIKRLSEHLSECRGYNHRRANWIKLLIKNGYRPELIILKVCPSCDFEKYESEYIKLYKSDKLTNSDDSGQGNKNRKREIIDNISKKLSKPVYRFDLNGDYIDEYKSTREASRNLSINHSNIVRCCNNKIKHTNQFIFRYDRELKVDKIELPNAVKKQVVELDFNGKVINKWTSLMSCSRDTGIDNGNLSRVCNGKLLHVKGRFFRFL